MVGIKWYAIWVSWWIRNIFIFLILSATITILSKIVLHPNVTNPRLADKAVLVSTDPIIILMLLLTYSVQVCSFIILFSQFFKKRNKLLEIRNLTLKNSKLFFLNFSISKLLMPKYPCWYYGLRLVSIFTTICQHRC